MSESTSNEALLQSGKDQRWTQIYNKAVPVCLGIFVISLVGMWGNALYSLFTKGGFKGAAGWLMWGIIYVWVRFFLLRAQRKQLTPEKDGKTHITRIRVMYYATIFNLTANTVAIVQIVILLSNGRLAWTKWDTVCSWIGSVAVLLTLILWGVSKLWAQSTLAVGTRFFQQGSLALSSQLLFIPIGTLWGLLGVAGQQALLSFFMNRITVTERHGGRLEAYALLGVDIFNLVAALAPLVWWYHMV